jgi:PadR family transcriptional regulator PadR
MGRLSDSDFLGEFEQMVMLAIARLEGEAYGMAIRREIEERSGRDVSIGAVYATIERLLGKDYLDVVTPSGRPADADGRARRFYALTRAGIGALETSRSLQARMWEGVRFQKAGKRG